MVVVISATAAASVMVTDTRYRSMVNSEQWSTPFDFRLRFPAKFTSRFLLPISSRQINKHESFPPNYDHVEGVQLEYMLLLSMESPISLPLVDGPRLANVREMSNSFIIFNQWSNMYDRCVDLLSRVVLLYHYANHSRMRHFVATKLYEFVSFYTIP